MSPEQNPESLLTPEQLEMADYFLEVCGLQDVADETFVMGGKTGSVRHGLGRCAEHLMDRDLHPNEIAQMVRAGLAER